MINLIGPTSSKLATQKTLKFAEYINKAKQKNIGDIVDIVAKNKKESISNIVSGLLNKAH